MDKIKFILSQCKIGHYGKWTPEAIDQCKNVMAKLSHEELFQLRTSKWFRNNASSHPLYYTLVESLNKEHFEKVFKELEILSTSDLLIRYRNLKANNCKIRILEILNERLSAMSEDEVKIVKPLLIRKGIIGEAKK